MATKRVLTSTGRAFPAGLAAHQFGVKHVALLESRIEQVAEAGALLLAGRPLSDAERLDLVAFLQTTLLPELYGDPD